MTFDRLWLILSRSQPAGKARFRALRYVFCVRSQQLHVRLRQMIACYHRGVGLSQNQHRAQVFLNTQANWNYEYKKKGVKTEKWGR